MILGVIINISFWLNSRFIHLVAKSPEQKCNCRFCDNIVVTFICLEIVKHVRIDGFFVHRCVGERLQFCI